MLITNATAFTGQGFRGSARIRVENGTITETEGNPVPRDGEAVLDLEGDFLLPVFFGLFPDIGNYFS